MTNEPKALSRNDVIQDEEEEEYLLLPEGVYAYTVKGCKFRPHPAGGTLDACEDAVVSLAVETADGTAYCRTTFPLHSDMKWKICEFFRSVGLLAPGEKLQMDWSGVIGRRGRALFVPVSGSHPNIYGEYRRYNSVSKFCDFDPTLTPVSAEADEQ